MALKLRDSLPWLAKDCAETLIIVSQAIWHGFFQFLILQERIMSKSQDSKKETKKEPAKSPKEKKEAKKAKKEEAKCQ